MAELLAGAAKVEITPPVGVELAGYGYFLARRSTGIADPLQARALVLEHGEQRVALVALDLIGIMDYDTAFVRRDAQERAGVPGEAVLVAGSHTHAGPANARLLACGEQDDAWAACLKHTLAGAIAGAARNLSPVTISRARGEVPWLMHNRVEGAGGPVDTELNVLALRGADGALLATLFNTQAHAVVNRSAENTLLSPDWPGAAATWLEENLGGTAFYWQGCCGDLNPQEAHTGNVHEVGRRVGEAVRDLLATAVPAAPALAAAMRPLELPFQPWNEAALREALETWEPKLGTAEEARARFEVIAAQEALARLDSQPTALVTEVQALRLGDTLLLCHGAEMFCEFGLAMKAASPAPQTMVVGYANSFIGYVADPEDFARGGYGATHAPKIWGQPLYTEDVGHRFVDALTELGQAVWAAGRR